MKLIPNLTFCRKLAEDGPETYEYMNGGEKYEIEVRRVK